MTTTAKEFTRESLRAIERDMMAALRSVEEKYGIRFQMGGGSFSPSKFSPKITATNGAKDPILESRNAMAAEVLGLPADAVGREIQTSRGTVRITGINPNSPKFPVKAVAADGRGIKLTVGYALQQLAAAPKVGKVIDATISAPVKAKAGAIIVRGVPDIVEALRANGVAVRGQWFEMNGASVAIKAGSAYVKVSSADPAGGAERKAQFTLNKAYPVEEVMSRIRSVAGLAPGRGGR